jgi:hypothetical protein
LQEGHCDQRGERNRENPFASEGGSARGDEDRVGGVIDQATQTRLFVESPSYEAVGKIRRNRQTDDRRGQPDCVGSDR